MRWRPLRHLRRPGILNTIVVILSCCFLFPSYVNMMKLYCTVTFVLTAQAVVDEAIGASAQTQAAAASGQWSCVLHRHSLAMLRKLLISLSLSP